MDYVQKMRRCNEYLKGLEEEKRKIQVFQRELPLCLELVTQAIEACKKEISGGSTTTDYMQQVQSECSEQTSSAHNSPVLEQFIPINKSSDDDDDDDQESHKTNKNIAAAAASASAGAGGDKMKSDWLRSVQLWNNNTNESPDPPSKEDVCKTGSVIEMKKNGGAFQPFHREKSTVEKSVVKNNVSATSTSTTESESREADLNKKEEKESGQQSQRKQRRCWSSELHRRFLHALQQLGGSHAATPKQIRELMKVDGLTNDEVKSHLQKYRLHSRRPSSNVHNNGNSQQAPQFVVVGGIWVSPQEYASMTATETAGVSPSPSPNGRIYAPVATQAQPTVQRPRRSGSEERGSHSEGRVHSNSTSTSSSTHTTTDHSHVL